MILYINSTIIKEIFENILITVFWMYSNTFLYKTKVNTIKNWNLKIKLRIIKINI